MNVRRTNRGWRCLASLGSAAVLAIGASCSQKTDDGIAVDTNAGASNGGASAASGSGGATNAGLGGSAPSPNAGSGAGVVVMPNGGAGGAMNCGAEAHEAVQRPLAMYLLVDQSISMTEFEDRWTPVSTAVQTFVADPASAGIRVALGYFPFWTAMSAIKCDALQYQTPAVPMGPLPDNAAAIQASFASKVFGLGERPPERGATPTRPAVEGSLAYLSGWIQANADHVGVLILATDGEPTTCDANTIPDSVALIAAAAAATPPLRTYVIGIGDIANLTLLADAGGTGRAPFLVDGTGTNTQAEFLQAMQAIRGAALPCQYAIPVPQNGTQDPNKVNVDYQPNGGATVPLVRAMDAAACAATPNGWYYDNPAAPTSILLCPDTCTAVSGSTGAMGARVSIALGCDTRVR